MNEMSMTLDEKIDEKPATATSSLGRNAALVIVISLVATAGSLIFIQMQGQRDDGHSQFEQQFTPEVRAFCETIFDGNVEGMKAMIARNRELITMPLPRFGSALNLATRQNQVEIARILLDNGADIDARGQWGGTPLHWAAMVGGKDMVQLLLDHGADVGVKTEGFGSTPLLWAAHGSAMMVRPAGADYLGVCQVLLKAGAPADTTNTMGESAVSLASEPVARFLYAHGGRLARPATRPTDIDVADSSDQQNY
jgi:hypothetical protein